MNLTIKESQLTHEQAQAERTAGQLLTKIAHEPQPQERARLLWLAFWHAGRAEAFEALVDKLESIREKRR